MSADAATQRAPLAPGSRGPPGTGCSTAPEGPRLRPGAGWRSDISRLLTPTAPGAFRGPVRVRGGVGRLRRLGPPPCWAGGRGAPARGGRGGGARRPRLLRSAAGRWARARRAGVRPGRAPPPELGRAIPMMPSHRARLPERGRRRPAAAGAAVPDKAGRPRTSC